MEIFGNASHANANEFLRHSVHAYNLLQTEWQQHQKLLTSAQSCSFTVTNSNQNTPIRTWVLIKFFVPLQISLPKIFVVNPCQFSGLNPPRKELFYHRLFHRRKELGRAQVHPPTPRFYLTWKPQRGKETTQKNRVVSKF